MKTIYFIIISLLSISFFSCGDMDATYKEFDKDPITYLTKIDIDSLVVTVGIKRVRVTLKPVKDIRADSLKLMWLNRTKSVSVALVPNANTIVELNDLQEGSIIMSCQLTDKEGNNSLVTDCFGFVYGENYAQGLPNRNIAKSTLSGDVLSIDLEATNDPNFVSVAVTYTNLSGTEVSEEFQSNKISITGVKGTTFKMKTQYKPEKNLLDQIWSSDVTYTIGS